jgi:FkbM family methyltransferase
MRGPLFLTGKLLENRFTRPIKRSIVRLLAAGSGTRTVLNRYYDFLGNQGRSRFHSRYAKIFRESKSQAIEAGTWTIEFEGRTIRLPLRPSSWGLDWDNAVSIVGHDIEIKETYAELIRSRERPELFVDVGANYGTHSVLFLSAGVSAMSFEPNPECFSYFEAVCALNGLEGRWEQVAIGDRTGQAELVYPGNETSLGSIAPSVVSGMKQVSECVTAHVPVKRLDDYLSHMHQRKILMKIDVEGSDREVIVGGSQFIKNFKPKIIFESIDVKTRARFFKLLMDRAYTVHLLPWRPSTPWAPLRLEEFVTCTANNFIAIPK